MIRKLLFIIILMSSTISFAGDCGDINNDSVIDHIDIVYLINYIYRSGFDPLCSPVIICADVDFDGIVNILDIVYLLDYKYKDGPSPICGSTADINGNVYRTVRIGNQVWMAENLKVTHYRNGDRIPMVADSTAWELLNTGAYCNFNNDINNVSIYGRLYNWYAADDSRGIAPAGWHVPTDEEWKQLEIYLGMNQTQADGLFWRGAGVGSKMKVVGTTYWGIKNLDANNESRFSALPGGYRYAWGRFNSIGIYAVFWSTTERHSSSAWYRHLHHYSSGVYRHDILKQAGFSIRCVKD